jgi:DNA-binding NtrC family response regulator
MPTDAPLRLLMVGVPDAGIRIGLDRLQERRVVDLRATDADGVEAASEAWAPDILLVIGSGRAVDGPEALRHWRQHLPETDAVVVRPADDSLRAAEWLRVGAFAVVSRPVEADELAEELERAAERVRLRAENRQLRRQLDAPRRFPEMIGQSKKMLELYELVGAVAGSDANILVLGENGTGKELIANAVHTHSARAHGPFIKINCAALPKELIEAELFGYRRGAFTGAFTDKAGRLAAARRDRRDAVVPAGQAAAGAAGAGVQADRQRSQRTRRLPPDLRDQRRRRGRVA